MADIVYKTVAFPDGFVNVAYEGGIATVLGATALTAGVVATGALPPGLVVNATDHTRITGVPTTAGTYTFTLTLTDTAGAVTSGSYTITIHNIPSPGIIRNAPLATQLKVQWPTEF
jgi:putative Ig domain-containing protein